jgi:hypothetical protein
MSGNQIQIEAASNIADWEVVFWGIEDFKTQPKPHQLQDVEDEKNYDVK